MKIKLLTAAVVSAVALLTPSIALADWVHVTDSPDGQFFVDDTSITRRGTQVNYWQQLVLKVPMDGLVKLVSAQMSVDCQSRAYRIQKLIEYNSVGRVVNEEKGNQVFENIPGTKQDYISQVVCSN